MGALGFVKHRLPTSQQVFYIKIRAFDTLSLLFDGFGGNQGGDLSNKIEFYRKKLLMATAQKYFM